MTIKEFKSLKKGDFVYIFRSNPKSTKKEVMMTEVIKIDRIFNKIEVVLGKKSYSYKYIQKKTTYPCSCAVGLGNIERLDN